VTLGHITWRAYSTTLLSPHGAQFSANVSNLYNNTHYGSEFTVLFLITFNANMKTFQYLCTLKKLTSWLHYVTCLSIGTKTVMSCDVFVTAWTRHVTVVHSNHEDFNIWLSTTHYTVECCYTIFTEYWRRQEALIKVLTHNNDMQKL